MKTIKLTSEELTLLMSKAFAEGAEIHDELWEGRQAKLKSRCQLKTAQSFFIEGDSFKQLTEVLER
jgi:hypothetical protein